MGTYGTISNRPFDGNDRVIKAFTDTDRKYVFRKPRHKEYHIYVLLICLGIFDCAQYLFHPNHLTSSFCLSLFFIFLCTIKVFAKKLHNYVK